MSSDKPLLNYHDALIYPSDLALLDSPSWLNDACINFQMTRLQHRQGSSEDEGAEGERSGKRQKNNGEESGGAVRVRLDDLFLDPSVISFLVHQLPEDDDDYEEELSNLGSSWNLPQPPTPPGHRDGVKKHRQKRVFVPISDQFGADRAAFAIPGGGSHWSLLLWEINIFSCNGNKASVGVYQHFDSSRGCNAAAASAVAKKLHRVLCASMQHQKGRGSGITHQARVTECTTPQQRNGYDCGVLTLGFADALSSDHGFGVAAEHRESLLETYFEGNGGHEKFASELRKQIADDIRQLAKGQG
ncbi:hypothetical protein ACHAXT_009673 [Thalassiosira profunda]